jgi:hypothetical protein
LDARRYKFDDFDIVRALRLCIAGALVLMSGCG